MLIGIGHKAQVGKDTAAQIINYLLDNSHIHDLDILTRGFLSNQDNLRGKTFEIKKFADKLKQVAAIMLGCLVEDLEDNNFKNTLLSEDWWFYKDKKGEIFDYKGFQPTEEHQLIKTTPRLFMQLLGTEAGRKIIHPNIWVNATMNGYKSLADKGEKFDTTLPNWIITDVRFPNEMDAIIGKKGVNIKIDRLICFNCENTEDFDFGDKFKDNSKTLTCLKCGYNFSDAHESETALDGCTKWDFIVDNNKDFKHLIFQLREILIFLNLIKDEPKI